jgi:hypothetical protein
MSAADGEHQSGRWFCPSGLSLGWNVQACRLCLQGYK